MGSTILLVILGLVVLLILIAVLVNIPAMVRYSKIWGQSRDTRPMGITTTPRECIVGPAGAMTNHH